MDDLIAAFVPLVLNTETGNQEINDVYLMEGCVCYWLLP